LRTGGTNKGGPGRPRDEFKLLLRQGAVEATKKFRQIVAESASETNVIKAGAVLITTAAPKQVEDVTPVERKPIPVVAILAALAGSAQLQEPERLAQFKMIQAIHAEAEIMQ
jgi:hypothetical protein